MGQDVINVKGLTKRYGQQVIVDKLDLTIPKGEIYGLLGPNGAGKSTTILMMMGLVEPTAGSISIHGVDPVSRPMEVKKRVGYLPEDVGFYDDRSGLENLVYTGRLNRLSVQEANRRALALLERVGLKADRAKAVGNYSRGMRQRLGLADVLLKQPEVIILDEPTLGLDPEGLRKFLELIVELSREEGLTVLLSSHHLQQVQQVCDRVGLFVAGKLMAEGDIANLSGKLFPDDPVVVEVVVDRRPPGGALSELLQAIEGVITVTQEEENLRIEADRDIASEVAQVVVNSGAGLCYLKRKDYGLDEIYHRFFKNAG